MIEAEKMTCEYSDDWKEDCMHFHGRVLTGKDGHWCHDWDGLPIDETCVNEYACCTCVSESDAESK